MGAIKTCAAAIRCASILSSSACCLASIGNSRAALDALSADGAALEAHSSVITIHPVRAEVVALARETGLVETGVKEQEAIGSRTRTAKYTRRQQEAIAWAHLVSNSCLQG